MDQKTREIRRQIARDVLRRHDVMLLNPGGLDGAPADEYNSEADLVADSTPPGSNVRHTAEIVAKVLSGSFGVDFSRRTCNPIAEELVARWHEQD